MSEEIKGDVSMRMALRAATALRELEAENCLYSESLANATQEIERLREALKNMVSLASPYFTDAPQRAAISEGRAALEGKG